MATRRCWEPTASLAALCFSPVHCRTCTSPTAVRSRSKRKTRNGTGYCSGSRTPHAPMAPATWASSRPMRRELQPSAGLMAARSAQKACPTSSCGWWPLGSVAPSASPSRSTASRRRKPALRNRTPTWRSPTSATTPTHTWSCSMTATRPLLTRIASARPVICAGPFAPMVLT